MLPAEEAPADLDAQQRWTMVGSAVAEEALDELVPLEGGWAPGEGQVRGMSEASLMICVRVCWQWVLWMCGWSVRGIRWKARC